MIIYKYIPKAPMTKTRPKLQSKQGSLGLLGIQKKIPRIQSNKFSNEVFQFSNEVFQFSNGCFQTRFSKPPNPKKENCFFSVWVFFPICVAQMLSSMTTYAARAHQLSQCIGDTVSALQVGSGKLPNPLESAFKKGDMGVEPKIGGKTPQNGWFIIMEKPIKMDDLGFFPLFLAGHPYVSF